METIKVLCLEKPGDGSVFHRINYIADKINGQTLNNYIFDITLKEFKDITIQFVKEFDIFIYEWDLSFSIQQLSEIQASGTKILYSISDYWIFSPNHPYFNNELINSYTANRVKQHILNADAVMVTTERLAIQAMKYNDNIAILPNFLDPKDYQHITDYNEDRRKNI